MLFKSRAGDEYSSLYSPWVNIQQSWEGRCVELSFVVTNTGEGQRFGSFEAERVVLAGFKVGTNSAPGPDFRGTFYLEQFALGTNPGVSYDFQESALVRDFRAIRSVAHPLGAAEPVVRVYALVDGRAGILWAADGSANGLESRVFDDFDALWAASDRAQVRVLLVLLDYKFFSRGTLNNGVQLGGHSNVARDLRLRQSFVQNVIDPIARRYANHPRLYAIEIVSEPEWVTSGIAGSNPDGSIHDPVTLDQMREFIRATIDTIRRWGVVPVTVGSARRQWTALWKDLVTLHSFHFYESDSHEVFPWRPSSDLALNGPVLVTEVPTARTRFLAGQYLKAAREGHYQGLMPWACRARDESSNFSALAADLGSRIPLAGPGDLVNAASFGGQPLAPEAWFALFGKNLAPALVQSGAGSLPTQLDGVRLTLTDAAGTSRDAPLLFVAPGQINFLVPPGTGLGPGRLSLSRSDGGIVGIDVSVARLSPGVFTANASGSGVPAALVGRVAPTGEITTLYPFQCGPGGTNCVPVPIRIGQPPERIFLILFGTGLRGTAGPAQTSVKIGAVEVPVQYAGPQGSYPGLDQINVELPRSLAGLGPVGVSVTVDGRPANVTTIEVQ
jgi:uncharacterized protein (TIGR03437 family)